MTSAFPHRRLIFFAGTHSWGESAACSLIKRSQLNAKQTIWLKEKDSALCHLGQNKHIAVMDAYKGLNPDVFGRLSGTLTAGGAMVLITPLLEEWSKFSDPFLKSIQPYSAHPKPLYSYYINRWVRLLSQETDVEIYDEKSTQLPRIIRAVSSLYVANFKATPDQELGVKEIIKAAHGQRRKPAILCADRGRGKSTALGIAAATLMIKGYTKKIIVTAGGQRQTHNLFDSAKIYLEQTQRENGCVNKDDISFVQTKKELGYLTSSIVYASVDTLLGSTTSCDFLIIEEAATIGIDRLEQLLIKYPRVAMATTEHGYEGSGRGFSLKFRRIVESRCRGSREINLKQPIRWVENDPLEKWTQQLLLLGSGFTPSNATRIRSLDHLLFTTIDQQQLAQDETLLEEVFGCLIDAHYQTRPKDLRLLLDAPNVQLQSATYNGEIIGLVWSMVEGNLSEQITKEIVAGKRRPQGHLAPQILAAHLSLDKAAMLKCLRIQRIVVKPQWQRQGIGQWMITQLQTQHMSHADYLASSFGCDLALLRFWQKSDFELVRMSDKTNAASGLHSAVMIKPFSKHAKRLTNEAGVVFTEQFIAQLSSSLRKLTHNIVVEIEFNHSNNLILSEQQFKRAMLFAYADLPYESSMSILKILAVVALTHLDLRKELTLTQRKLLVSRVLQNHPWPACEQHNVFTGKAEMLTALRKSVQIILQVGCSQKQIKALVNQYNLR